MSVLTLVLAAVGAITIAAVAVLFLVGNPLSKPAPGVAPILPIIPSMQVLFDEQMAVSASGWQSRGFSLGSATPVQVMADGVKDADKGFNVYVMDKSDCDLFAAKKPFQHYPALQGLQVRSFSRTSQLGPGRYCAVVANTENIFNTMVVHFRLVTNP